jgi:hypothetical protein
VAGGQDGKMKRQRKRIKESQKIKMRKQNKGCRPQASGYREKKKEPSFLFWTLQPKA